jgi:ankyrin repeat protein
VNNCQNFAKYLLETICPDARIPDTIQTVLLRFQELVSTINTNRRTIPGAYPQSITSDDCNSFITASGGTSWYTPTETSWVTAVNYSIITARTGSEFQLPAAIPPANSNTRRKENIITRSFATAQRTLFGKYSLIRASQSGDLKRVQMLLEQDANTEVKDLKKQGRTALHWAVINAHEDVVMLLLNNGADIRAVDDTGMTALHLAANDDITYALEQILSDRDNDEGELPQRDRDEKLAMIIQLLLEKGANVKAVTVNGRTPLHVAAAQGHKGAVELLLDHGADLEARDHFRWTALHVAARESKFYTIQLLLEKGADVNAVDGRGWTLLQISAYTGESDIVELLLDHGADLEVADEGGRTALHRAAQRGHKDVVELLLSKGANIRVITKTRQTALDYAAMEGHGRVVGLLIENGAVW